MTSSGPHWYLFDYGMVISTAPAPEDWRLLEQATGLRELAAGTSPYWERREDFDAGRLTPAQYWGSVLGRDPVPAEVETLEELDAAQWSHLNPRTVEVLQTLHSDGANLALLSNMPAGMSRRYSTESSWAQYFSKLYFSGQMGLVKPDRRIFDRVVAGLGAAPEGIVFIDDNLQNISTARAMGFHTVLHTSGTDLRAELAGRGR
ncbi:MULTISPECIES: HAD family phosphatase [unclassified Arthrobacter]|uniref:HAD family hydrolase n=1 Tax=unclassified Arthrobacter TaxID=235627 RepID=UPI001D157144|nr:MULTISPECIES: HAD family phosphatase [unclassified Arthrobacter]MCC3292784.1 HAD family phosphatase [Arthrobacter sp. zg-Y1110]MCC3303161.1 HAD family phosphatase [Arthrobacter sp. zg-Y895]UWX86055.1 HAD family phosphatase [Arthrobacter sp. zg-Y1110]